MYPISRSMIPTPNQTSFSFSKSKVTTILYKSNEKMSEFSMFLGKQKLHEKKRNTSFSKTHRVKEKLLESPFVRKVTLPRVAKMIPR